MRFRPCIDIHNGKVKQIVGGTFTEETESVQENYVSEHDAAWFARFYEKDGLEGGHIIMLNRVSSPEYGPTREAALRALREVPGLFQRDLLPEEPSICRKKTCDHNQGDRA